MPWYYYVGAVLFGIVAFGFTLQLLIEVWQQIILGRYKIPDNQGAFDIVRVANELPQIKRKIDYHSWLSKEEFELVRAEMKRQSEAEEKERATKASEPIDVAPPKVDMEKMD